MPFLKKCLPILAVLMILILNPFLPDIAPALEFRPLTSIYSDGKNVGLKQPEGVACKASTGFIIVDTGNGRLLQYVLDDKNQKPDVAIEIKIPQISYPLKAELNSAADIYVLDGKERRIIHLTPQGIFKGYLEPRGLPDPGGYVPRSFCIDANDHIYILDVYAERVLVLNAAGDYQNQIAFPEEYGFFSDLAVDAKGSVLLIDSIRARLYHAAKDADGFSPLTQSLQEFMRFPTSLTTDSRGRIYLVDRNGGSVAVLGQDGSFLTRQSAMGWKEGRLNFPSQICATGSGEVFIADTNNNRIQIFKTVE